jgi:hypothetical protein
METLGHLFAGNIARWDDARLSEHSPSLAAAFAASGESPAITLVFCGRGSWNEAAHTAASNHFILALNGTRAWQSSGLSATLPADWSDVTRRLAARGIPFVWVQGELELEATVRRIPGALGYVLAFSSQSDVTSEVQIAVPAPSSDPLRPDQLSMVPVAATPESYLACAAVLPPDSGVDFLDHAAAARSSASASTNSSAAAFSRCWSIPMLLSLGVATDVHATRVDRAGVTHVSRDIRALCDRQRRVLKFVQWTATDPSVPAMMQRAGRVALAQLPAWREEILRSLNELQCDGEPLLWTRPVVWSLSRSVASFGVAAGSIGLALCALTAVLVVLFRRRSSIQASGMPFHATLLSGLALLFLTPILFAQTPSPRLCDGLAWLFVLGTGLTFGPMGARLWRTHAIASRNKHGKASVRRSRLPDTLWMRGGVALAHDLRAAQQLLPLVHIASVVLVAQSRDQVQV